MEALIAAQTAQMQLVMQAQLAGGMPHLSQMQAAMAGAIPLVPEQTLGQLESAQAEAQAAMAGTMPQLSAEDGQPETDVICATLQSKPELVSRVLTFIADQVLSTVDTCRFNGVLKTHNEEHGYGFISCAEMQLVYGSDVWVHASKIGAFEVGASVSFAVEVRDGKPQAKDLSMATAVVSTLPVSAAAASSRKRPGGLGAGNGREGKPVGVGDLIRKDLVGGFGESDGSGGMGLGGLGSLSGGMGLAGLASTGSLTQSFGMKRQMEMLEMAKQLYPNKQGRKGSGKKTESRGADESGGILGQFCGTLKSFADSTGYGFIECADLQVMGFPDVFLHHSQKQHYNVGDAVYFTAFLNSKGKPQAKDLCSTPTLAA